MGVSFSNGMIQDLNWLSSVTRQGFQCWVLDTNPAIKPLTYNLCCLENMWGNGGSRLVGVSNSAHRGSQRLKLQSWSLHGSVLRPLHMLWLFICGTPNVRIGLSLTLLPALGIPFLVLVTLSSLNMSICT